MNLPSKLVLTIHLALFCVVAVAADPEKADSQEDESANRITDNLVAFYDFASDSGPIVHDRSGNGVPINLEIEDMAAVRRKEGSLTVRGKTLIASSKAPSRLSAAIKKSAAVSIEAWITPLDLKQSGPARIITLSKDSTNRNFTLGQDGNKFDVRFRTKQSDNNGLPSTASKNGTVKKRLTHVAYTRARNGDAKIFIDGQLNSTKRLEGNLSNWQRDYQLGLANEINKSRPWKGSYHLVAIYNKALSLEQVQQNYVAGVNGKSGVTKMLAKKQRDPKEIHFELEVASILSNQCLECHDTLSNKGGLDLSRKVAAFKGGDSGEAIVARDANESLLWQSIESDEMPHERPPLSDKEKQVIKKWIDDGATWSLAMIDPAVYVHGGRPDTNWIRRLTIPEYVATVRALFDVDVSDDAHRLLPPDERADGFSNTAYNLTVDLKHVQAYQQLAQIVVSKIDSVEFAKRFERKVSFNDKPISNLIRSMGKRMLRGPLNDREVTTYHGIYTTLASSENNTGSEENLREVTQLLIEALLQSTRFIYRIESQRGDGSELPLNEYELATRLSYSIWGAPPDDKLFEAAEDGNLYDTESIQQQVDRMLKDPRALEHAKRFYAEWLHLARLQNMQPNKEKFPNWDPQLAEDMRDESLAFFEEVVWNQNRPLSNLLNARLTLVTPRLAKHYGLPEKSLQPGEKLVRYDLSDKQRGGMLTQGSVLTVGGDEASMVTRGLLVMDELLRGVVKDPPPCVDTTPVPTEPGLSQRAIAEKRIANETCGGCHSRFEPLAFGLEKFDGLGGFHDSDEHGNELRDDGQIVFPGASEPVAYRTSRELMDLMAGNDRVKESITWKLTQFVLGRPLTAIDAGPVQAIHQAAQKNGGSYAATITAITTSDLFTMIRTDK